MFACCACCCCCCLCCSSSIDKLLVFWTGWGVRPEPYGIIGLKIGILGVMAPYRRPRANRKMALPIKHNIVGCIMKKIKGLWSSWNHRLRSNSFQNPEDLQNVIQLLANWSTCAENVIRIIFWVILLPKVSPIPGGMPVLGSLVYCYSGPSLLQ